MLSALHWLVPASGTPFRITLVKTSSGPLAVVARDVLVQMKRMAGRPQDAADIEKLEASDE